MLEAADETTPWQRVLWLKQPGYPDNYLDPAFLVNLQRNVNVRKYTYSGLIYDTLPVTQHLCSTVAFVAVFAHVYNGLISPGSLLAFVGVSFFSGYVWWSSLTSAIYSRTSVFTSALALSLVVFLISPILQTLSKATTSDSIWPLSACLLLLNAMLNDYSSGAGEAQGFPSSLSLNAGICASAVLSSRLASHMEVFALMLLSIEWFALLPLLRQEILQKLSSRSNATFTAALVATSFAVLLPMSVSISMLYITAIFALQFGIPRWLLSLQGLKNEIRGPWDAAVPKIAGNTIAL